MGEGLEYLARVAAVLHAIDAQADAVRSAAGWMAETIGGGRLVHVFGSGHSVIPCLDIFPRYGSFVGFHPLLDPHLMWFSVVGSGGAPELLWLERAPGYVANFLESQPLTDGDMLLVFSHGGLNAAPIEAAQYAHSRGMRVVAVTSNANLEATRARGDRRVHLSDVADLTIDNGIVPEDALVTVPGVPEPLAAGSTVAVVAVAGALVAETGRVLGATGNELDVFVSPNVPGVAPDHNREVFARYRQALARAAARRDPTSLTG